MTKDVIDELYRALVLLGAESDLLGTVGSWRDGLPDRWVAEEIRAWNEGALKEITGRIEHYGMTSRRPGDSLASAQGKSTAG